MKNFKICFAALAVALLLLSCGVDKPDMGGGSMSPDRDHSTDSDISEEPDQPDSSRPENDPDADKEDDGYGSRDEANAEWREDADPIESEDPDSMEDADLVENEDLDSPEEADFDDFEEPNLSENEDSDTSDGGDPDLSGADSDAVEDFDGSSDSDSSEAVDEDEESEPEGPQFANGDMQNWVDGAVTGWKKSEGALAALTMEKEETGGGNFALRVTQPQNSKNKPGFESEEFETSPESPLPVRIEFRVKTGAVSKIAAELVCGETGLKYKYIDETKTFVKSGNYSYNQIELPSWTTLSIEFGEEMTSEFWQEQLCRLSFKTGSALDFDVSFDDFRIIY